MREGMFPTKILLATEGSEEATLVAQTAIDLADKTGSEFRKRSARASLGADVPTSRERPCRAWRRRS
jgi:hypothetical protein